jgi:hypothetical protein
MAQGSVYIGSELHPEKINDMDCSDEVLAHISFELQDLRKRVAVLERTLLIAGQIVPGLKDKAPA